jgi:two-component system LytT family response regulator
MLKQYCSNITAIKTANSVKTGIDAINSFEPDIVLLDVEMEDGTGFDLMQRIPNPQFQLIFITAHDKYAIDAFRFSAIDYLLKPVDPDLLQKAISKASNKQLSNNLQQQVQVLLQQLNGMHLHDRKIVLKDIDNTYFIKIQDILYCEAEGTYTKFFIQNSGSILVSKNLKEYEAILEPMGFIRTHHSYLANPDKIVRYEKSDGGALILEGGYAIPISQRKKDTVMEILERR